MKKAILLTAITCMVVLAGVANAGANVWNPALLDPNAIADVGNWNVDGNWSYGWVPTSAEKTASSNDVVPCVIDSDTDAVTGQFVWGDNGPDLAEHELTIYGTLHTCVDGTSWGTSGYNRASTINVERGGTLTAGSRFGIGLVGDPPVAGTTSYLNVNGGTMTVDGDLQIGSGDAGTDVGHLGLVNVFAGTLTVLEDLSFRDPCFSFIDISHGTVTFANDEVQIGEDPNSLSHLNYWVKFF